MSYLTITYNNKFYKLSFLIEDDMLTLQLQYKNKTWINFKL